MYLRVDSVPKLLCGTSLWHTNFRNVTPAFPRTLLPSYCFKEVYFFAVHVVSHEPIKCYPHMRQGYIDVTIALSMYFVYIFRKNCRAVLSTLFCWNIVRMSSNRGSTFLHTLRTVKVKMHTPPTLRGTFQGCATCAMLAHNHRNRNMEQKESAVT